MIVQEINYQPVMSWDLAAKFMDEIPTFSENDPARPEWKATPIVDVDLTSDGYGLVHVKDESNLNSNPTGTIKDRPAWELTAEYRKFASTLFERMKTGTLARGIWSVPVPRFSCITAGNVGRAISYVYRKYGLPPMKLLLDVSTPASRLEVLRKLHADIYLTDLSRNVFERDEDRKRRAYTPEEILTLTNNRHGIDITSAAIMLPHMVFYDWHVHEAFNANPDEIYVPYGSGRLWENYLTWQRLTVHNESTGRRDPRLRVPVGRVAGMSILGAEPLEQNSSADKLTKSFNPFTIFNDQDAIAMGALCFTGEATWTYRVPEERIKQAYRLLGKHLPTEPSAAAGLALYLHRFDEGLVDPRKKILIVNTGKGI